MGFYDIIIQGNTLKDISVLYDALLMTTSSMISDAIDEMLFDQLRFGPGEKIFKTVIIEAIASSVIYSFGYSFILNNKFPALCGRENGANYIIGFVIVLVSNWLENPIMKLFGWSIVG